MTEVAGHCKTLHQQPHGTSTPPGWRAHSLLCLRVKSPQPKSHPRDLITLRAWFGEETSHLLLREGQRPAQQSLQPPSTDSLRKGMKRLIRTPRLLGWHSQLEHGMAVVTLSALERKQQGSSIIYGSIEFCRNSWASNSTQEQAQPLPWI